MMREHVVVTGSHVYDMWAHRRCILRPRCENHRADHGMGLSGSPGTRRLLVVWVPGYCDMMGHCMFSACSNLHAYNIVVRVLNCVCILRLV